MELSRGSSAASPAHFFRYDIHLRDPQCPLHVDRRHSIHRDKLIVLTDPGKRLIDETVGRHVANEERLLLSLTQAEQETLDAPLKKLIAGL
jgi:hypothetical protein